MEVIVGIESIQKPLINPALTIGNFDGVHRGHQALFQRVKDWAARLQGQSVVMTFNPHPLEVFRPGNGPAFITTHERKLELIAQAGIEVTIVVPFDRTFAQTPATDFVKELLVDRIGIRAIVVGHDYRFGKGREGDIDFLRKMAERYAFDVDAVSGIDVEGTIVSSTLIRQCIHGGDLREAGRLLGRPYEIKGTVVKGRNRGARLLGFPTANIDMASHAAPKRGVYAVQVEIDGRLYGGAANLGYNPTFGDTALSLEVHILDFSDDVYGKSITVRFIDRLRDERKFSGIEELTQQISRDVEIARQILLTRAPGGPPITASPPANAVEAKPGSRAE
ncbi:MAG: bifunctional riboflavin kinase/FAD synthetase [Syntrophobacteraceae bacterium]|jgi:riboflavin kinase/FMN adenylyltransferase|nr:bifunctional riboflavin kinase/FAD synthetase [Syntrophobacteraceae bacterium]